LNASISLNIKFPAQSSEYKSGITNHEWALARKEHAESLLDSQIKTSTRSKNGIIAL